MQLFSNLASVFHLLAAGSPPVLDQIYAIFCMLGGLAVFMFGMKMLGDNLESLAGDNVRKLLGKATSNRFSGVAVGAGVTAIIQSSSATTVMLVGFVNVGLMTLTQAAAVIMGANIGTTITLQIISLKAYFNVTAIVSLFAVVGMFINMFSQRSKLKLIGVTLIALGMLFIGLDFMSASMDIFREIPAFIEFFRTVRNPLLLLVVGLVFTAIIQSSSAATSILAGLMAVGVTAEGSALPLSSAMYAVLGMNIGTCITAILSSIGANANAKRTAMIHLLFNVIGVIVMFVLLLFFEGPIVRALEYTGNEIRQLANFHTAFNVITTVLLFPFLPLLVKLATKIIPDDKVKDEMHLVYLDERLLETPSIAISELVNEIVHLSELAKGNVDEAYSMLEGGYDENKNDKIKKNEARISFLTKSVTEYMVKISALDITYEDEVFISSLYHVVSDIERIGDYADNIIKYTRKLKETGITLSEDALGEVGHMYDLVTEHFKLAMHVFRERRLPMLGEVARLEQEIDNMKLEMADKHIMRLNRGSCSPEAGAVYLSLSANLERMADHITNVAFSIRRYTKVRGSIRANAPEEPAVKQ